MPRFYDQKLKILYIRDYLEKNSHPNHPVTANELMEMLWQDYEIRCERKTIYSDIEALKEYGLDIIALPGKNGGYYIDSRNFDLPEIKLLVDAVQSSRYLTEQKSRELIEKLCKECSVHDARLLRRTVTVAGRVKSMNESIYNNLDYIQEAIAQNKQITFRYFDWNIKGQRAYRNKPYAASPYGLCHDNDYCYLVSWTERHGTTSFRVDRMSNILISDQSRIPCPELTGKAFTEYANRTFYMFAGETMQVRLRFHNSMINVVIDRFGRQTLLIPDGQEHFIFTVPVAISPMFLSWVMGFGDKAQILSPQAAVEACKALCNEISALYQPTAKDEKI